jgi:hypothetical protein
MATSFKFEFLKTISCTNHRYRVETIKAIYFKLLGNFSTFLEKKLTVDRLEK